MAAYIKTLQDAARENIIYPKTKSEAVYRDDNITSVEDTLVDLQSQIINSVADWNQNDASALNYIQNKPFGEAVMVPLAFNVERTQEYDDESNTIRADLSLETWSLYKTYKIVIREDEFIFHGCNTITFSDYDFYIWGDWNLNDFPFYFYSSTYDYDANGDYILYSEEDSPYLSFYWNKTVYPNLNPATEVQIYTEEVIDKIDQKYLPDDCAKKPFVRKVTLPASYWNKTTLTQSVLMEGILSDEAKQIIQCSPYGSDIIIASNSGVYCSGQDTDSLTFTCIRLPSEDIEFVISWQDANVNIPKLEKVDNVLIFNKYFTGYAPEGRFNFENSSLVLETYGPDYPEYNNFTGRLSFMKNTNISFDYEFKINAPTEGSGVKIYINGYYIDESVIFEDFSNTTGKGHWDGMVSANNHIDLNLKASDENEPCSYLKLSNIIVKEII